MCKIYSIFLIGVVFATSVFGQKSVTLPKTSEEITIDGEATEDIWSNEAVTTQVIESLITEVAPADEYDFSATWKGFYTESSLYLMVEVTDADIIYQGEDVANWQADKLEIYFGFDPAETEDENLWATCASGLFQIPFLVEPDPEDGVPCALATYSGREYAVVETVDGYVMEIKMDFDVFNDGEGDPVSPSDGLIFDFDIMVNDNDGDEISQSYWSADMHLWNYPWNATQGSIELGEAVDGGNGGNGGGEPTASVSEYGTLATLPKADVDVTIDGAADEDIWSNEAVTTQVIESLITEVAPADEYDFLATWKGFYTESSLYLMVEVTDADIIYQGEDVANWQADKLEIYFGFDPAETEDENLWATCASGLFQIPFLVEPDPEDGVPCALATYSGREYAVVETVDGYVMEIKMDFDVFNDGEGDPVSPSDGLIFNFDIMVNDNDGDETSQSYWSADMHLWNYPWNGTQGAIELGATLGTSVKDVKTDRVNVYPNPVMDRLVIRGDVDNVVIYDLTGRGVLSAKMSGNKNTLSLAHLQQGVYILKAVRAGKFVATEKIQVK